jgi:hypothetical protein
MNGPVPTGCVCTLVAVSRTALGDTIESGPDAARFRNGANGLSKLT